VVEVNGLNDGRRLSDDIALPRHALIVGRRCRRRAGRFDRGMRERETCSRDRRGAPPLRAQLNPHFLFNATTIGTCSRRHLIALGTL
jgi:hypothetical protein